MQGWRTMERGMYEGTNPPSIGGPSKCRVLVFPEPDSQMRIKVGVAKKAWFSAFWYLDS